MSLTLGILSLCICHCS